MSKGVLSTVVLILVVLSHTVISVCFAGSAYAQNSLTVIAADKGTGRAVGPQRSVPSQPADSAEDEEFVGPSQPVGGASDHASDGADTVLMPDLSQFTLLSRDPLERIVLENIKPLYESPALPGEGVWQSADSPKDALGRPVIYTTFYRPSLQFPNAIVYMMVLDMSKLFMQYYVGSQEPGARLANCQVEPGLRTRLAAITNAMWMQRHAKGAGAIFRGKVLYPMVDGMATLIVYKDGSVDIREWGPDIPINMVRDARQLRHLIVKDGMVVRHVLRKGRLEDAEIGLGFLLGGGGRDYDGDHAWYVAHRSAFGVRKDGNLIFAIGHHIGTKDLAKALVLGGCIRGLHADANPANIVGNLYMRDSNGNLLRKVKLSPEQSKYALERYEGGYSKDFFGFFFRSAGEDRGRALTKCSTPERTHR
ncbi:MAG: hypothetical protein LDL33_08785 [Desulfomonile sp.]|nr:hypothetical protein [Desulfomonile sp.]